MTMLSIPKAIFKQSFLMAIEISKYLTNYQIEIVSHKKIYIIPFSPLPNNDNSHINDFYHI